MFVVLLGVPRLGVVQSDAPEVPTLQSRATLVLVDLVATDRAGKAVVDLTTADLSLTDNGRPQMIRSFEAHLPVAAPAMRSQPQLPPGMFSNAQAGPVDAPVLNVLLIDALNTPMADQSFLHQQLAQFLRVPNAAPMAVYGLTTHLIELQGFTDDPHLLRSAVEHMGPRSSTARNDNVSTGAETRASDVIETSLGGGDREIGPALARLRELEALTDVQQDRTRQHETLDALDALANYLANLPGRKNVIWFSGAFPLDVLPDARLSDRHEFRNTGNDVVEQLRDTSALLTRARVALYPVDARGLFNVPTYDPGARTMMDPDSLTRGFQLSNQQVADQHEVMRTMAEETGGHAFVNTNGLARAVSQAVALGSTFYTLTYTPSPADARASLHHIHIGLTGRVAGARVSLSYRHSYVSTPLPQANGTSGRRTLTTGGAALALPADENALRLAMMHGAPEIGTLPFTVEVRPAGAAAQPIDPKTHPSGGLAHGPWRTLQVAYTLPADALLQALPTGDLTGTVQFTLHCYNSDGQLLTSTSDAVRMNLAQVKAQLAESSRIPFQQRISVPQGARADSLWLRVGVQNLATGAVGALELPVAAINKLPPAALPATQTAAPRLAHP